MGKILLIILGILFLIWLIVRCCKNKKQDEINLYKKTTENAQIDVELSENFQQKHELYEKLNFSQKKFISHVNVLEENLNKDEDNRKAFNVPEYIKEAIEWLL